jgi:O-antigen/teichoic acid export membrane protein
MAQIASFPLASLRSFAPRAAWAAADQGIYPIVQLALTPYLLFKLGRQDFGIWMLAVAALSMSQLVSWGAGIATTKHVSADMAAGAKSEAIEVARAALAVAMMGGLLAAFLGWMLAPLIVAHFFRGMGPLERTVPVLALCGLAAAIQEIDNVFAGALRGVERFDLCAQAEVPARLIMGAVIALLASQGCSVHTLFAALIPMMAAKAALKAWQVSIQFQSAKSALPSFTLPTMRRVAAFGFWQWLQSAGALFFSASDQILVGGLLGAVALARYSACLQIAQYVHMVPSVMVQVIFPRLSALGSQLDAVSGNRILNYSTIAALGTSIVLGMPLILFADQLLKLWIGPAFAAENHQLLIVLIVVHITLAANIGGYFVLLGSGRTARSAAIVLSAGAAQSLFAILVAPMGLMAVALNRFVYSALTSFLYFAARYRTNER